MKKLFVFLFIALFCSISFSQRSKIGLGVIIGDPTGISAKFWTGDNSAFDAAAAWDLAGGSDALLLHADFLKHKFDLIPVTKGELPIYYGIGARIILMNDINVAARIPVGISYIFDDLPLDTFLEIVPVLNILPSTHFDADAAIGIRYYF
jgi:hypothetical protein